MKPIAKLALAAAALVIAAPAGALRDWTLLGQRDLSRAADRDMIVVAGSRRFSQIRICASRQGVRFHDVEISFRGGGSQAVRLRSIIPFDRCSGGIDLRGHPRDIARIAFAYEPSGIRPHGARVRLFGR